MMGKQIKYHLDTREFLERSCISRSSLKRKIKGGEIRPIKERNRLFFHYSFLPDEESQEVFLRERGLIPKTEEAKEVRGYQDLKLWEKKAADKKEAIIKEFLVGSKDIPPGKVKEVKRRFAKQRSIHYRTLDRWAADYKKHGYYGLIPNWNPGSQKKLIDRKIGKFVDDTYLTPLGPSKKETFERLIDEFADKRDRLPSYKSMAQHINSKWTKSQQLLVRNKDEWDRLYSPYVRRDWTKVKLNEVWIGDAKQIDIACLFRNKAVFPWFTAYLDARSRKFVGYTLTPIHDALSIAQSYVYAVSKYGPPKTCYFDLGKPYRSYLIAGTKVKKGKIIKFCEGIDQPKITGILRELGTEIFFAAPYNGREKIIEPNFKIFTYRMSSLPGYRGHSIRVRPKKLAREIRTGKLLPFEELSKEVDRIVEDRNNRPHTTTGRAPNSFYENYNAVIPSQDLLNYLLMDVTIASVKDASVTIKGLLYRSDQLWHLSGEKVEVRRDPKDIRRAAIIYKGKLFCIATLETPSHYRDAITLESVKTARRTRKRIKNWRKAVIENEDYIEDPLRMAVVLDEKEKVRERDIRPASSKVRSLHRKQGLAKDVLDGFKSAEVGVEVEEEVVAAGGDGSTTERYRPLFPIRKQVRAEAPDRLPLFRLTINDDFEDD